MNWFGKMGLPAIVVFFSLLLPAFAQDTDSDGVLDDTDNCIEVPNGPGLGTCVETVSGMVSGTGISCNSDGDCSSGENCDTTQGDVNANGRGDVCECYADSNCDTKVDLSDLVLMKKEFLRSDCPSEFCYANANGDNKVDLSDLVILKSQFLKPDCSSCARPVGVLFAVHGGTDTHQEQYLWDAGLQQFSYDPNHSVYKLVIWNSGWWDFVMKVESSKKFMGKYDFEYPRIGGTDPFAALTEQQMADMEAELALNPYGINFEADWIAWMCGDCVDHYPYPRFIYFGPDGLPDPAEDYEDCRYCGENEPGGPWPGCDPDRYNVDGPVERLLKKGVTRIIMVDLTVGGVRFSKTYDIVQMSKKMLGDWEVERGISIPLLWVNDYSNLMERSYPTTPQGWTSSLGPPDVDSEVLLNGNPNPVASDPDLAALQVQAIEAGWGNATDATTGVILLNHAINDEKEYFDPKMDDTVLLNENIKTQLLALHPTMNPDNIIGARMGIKEENPLAEHTLVERTRFMRGENLGHQYLYETAKVFPSGGSDPRGLYHPWGYLYWDALEYLKNRGVEHIVIGFPQIVTDSVLNLVEFPNQIGKEIGKNNWLGNRSTIYPVAGNPFADYWGNWVYTDCAEWEIQFDGGTEEIAAGGMNPVTLDGQAMLVGDTSGATGVIKQVIVESGSWFTGDASGRIILKELSGSFIDNEPLHDSKGTPGNALANGGEVQTISSDCCFVMGGCPDDGFGNPRPYPPPRLTPLPDRRHDMDPSLAYQVSEYGHIGYDPLSGAPDPNNPVQSQYTGTWEMYTPPNDAQGIGQLLAKHVLNATVHPMVYMTNTDNLSGITVGGSVTFEATAFGGEEPYTYQWSANRDDSGWNPVGGNSTSWSWSPSGGEEGTYSIRCQVTDNQSYTGEVVWEDFIVQ